MPYFYHCTLLLLLLTAGVHISLRGMNLSNNSVVFLDEIGDQTIKNGSELQCITDRELCCRYPYTAGQWFFPNGSKVPVKVEATGLYKNRGYAGTVNLNRPNTTVTSPTGLFCCILPDAQGINQMLCVNIGV